MRQGILGLVAAAAFVAGTSPARAQLLGPRCTPVAPLNCPPGGPYLTPPPGTGTTPAAPGTTPQDPNNPNAPNPAAPGQTDPLQNAFAQGSEGGGASPSSFNDNFNGDFGGIFVTRRVLVGNVTTSTVQTAFAPGTGITKQTITTSVPVYRNVVVPLATRYNGVLITDNDSPRPTDRVYFGYNYYNGVGTGLNQGFDRIDQHRQTVGFEKTVLDGNGSVGMRLPFVQQTGGPGGFAQGNVGDLSVLLKYAFYNNRTTGDVGSVGLVVTTPTGGGNNLPLSDGSTVPNSVLLQPWVGGVRMFGAGYAQGISSMLIPTDRREPLLFNNSVSVGYFVYQNADDRFINAVVPFFEAHSRTPLNHRDIDSPIFFQDQLNLTVGTHFRTTRATISPGFNVPLVKPQAYNGEFNLMVNIRF